MKRLRKALGGGVLMLAVLLVCECVQEVVRLVYRTDLKRKIKWLLALVFCFTSLNVAGCLHL